MQWNKKYDYPKSSRATVDGIRRDLLGEAKLPSVTSILDQTRSEEDKAALANWRERTGYKEAEAITKAASSRGSQMHNYLESYLLGRENQSYPSSPLVLRPRALSCAENRKERVSFSQRRILCVCTPPR